MSLINYLTTCILVLSTCNKVLGVLLNTLIYPREVEASSLSVKVQNLRTVVVDVGPVRSVGYYYIHPTG